MQAGHDAPGAFGCVALALDGTTHGVFLWLDPLVRVIWRVDLVELLID